VPRPIPGSFLIPSHRHNWAYVTGGSQFTSYAPAATNIARGQLSCSIPLRGGGVPVTYAWQTNNGVNSGPLITGAASASVPRRPDHREMCKPGDAGTYTLQVSTPLHRKRRFAKHRANRRDGELASFFTRKMRAGLAAQFQMNFSGPVGVLIGFGPPPTWRLRR